MLLRGSRRQALPKALATHLALFVGPSEILALDRGTLGTGAVLAVVHWNSMGPLLGQQVFYLALGSTLCCSSSVSVARG